MSKLKFLLFFTVLLSLLLSVGCAGETAVPVCVHDYGPLHSAVPADLFADGNIAYYRCADCGALFDGQKAPVDSVAVPRLSPELCLLVGSEAYTLTPATQQDGCIRWSLTDVPVAEGEGIALRSARDAGTALAYTPLGHIGEDGRALLSAQAATFSLTATADSLELSLDRVCIPSDAGQYRILCAGAAEPVVMDRLQLDAGSDLWDEFRQHANSHAQGCADIAHYTQQNGLQVYSAVLTLDAGTVFRMDGGSSATAVDPSQATVPSEQNGCVTLGADTVTVTQSGTYHIQYIPAYGALQLTQLTSGSLQDAAMALDRQIAAIPSGQELARAGQIRQLYSRYLCQSQLRPLLRAGAKLEQLYSNLQAAPGPVSYCLSDPATMQVYPSKQALCESFYTDFYYYIAVFHGTARLETYGIRCAGDFVALATDFYGAGTTDLYGIGFVAGRYLLESDRNGILQEQSEQVFFGFCYRNGLYRELLPFFIRYFAYWRLDEHYANLSNPGADLFAEAWAPTVDIAKFFYYDAQTSYVQSERVLDCFTSIAGVAYGLDTEAPLPQLRLRGYTFEGWYSDPAFTGAPVTALDPTAEHVTLYAKWRADPAQQAADSAALVDVYIYNLTTAPARVSTTTVGYVTQMYDALTADARALVTRYSTLQALGG